MRNGTQVAVIGAGYAGMAAAVELAGRHIPVSVFEASRVLGGRSRAVRLHGETLDNGQHILIGAYHETLRLMALVGADPARHLLRLPLHLEFPGEFRISAPKLPAPLHLAAALLCARGLAWREKLAAIRFMQAMQAANFRLASDIRLSELLDRQRQPPRVRQYLWHALCIAALNTPAEDASAQIFLNVLRDSLAAGRSASDLLLPRVDLSALFPEAAARYLIQRSGDPAAIRRSTAIRRIDVKHDGQTARYSLHADSGHCGSYSHVIIATAPQHLPALLAGLPSTADIANIAGMLDGFSYQPILTCYLAYPAHVRLVQPMLGHGRGIMQWLFDRGQLDGQAGLLAAVVSANGPHLALSRQELAARIHDEIAAFVPALPAPIWTQAITEKRATWSCTPGLQRPATETALPGLLLAGDYVAGDYPGTIEAAVRSGVAAAQRIRHA